jgi:hypothetical protein
LSLVQGFEVLAVLALAVAIAAGVGLYLVFRQLQRYRRDQHVVMGSRGAVDIVEHVSSMDDKLANMRVALEDLALVARDHDVRIDGTLARIGVVRFDAYQDLGGRQSAAVAFLNSQGNGVVITTVVSRDFARMYVKLLKDGQPDIGRPGPRRRAVHHQAACRQGRCGFHQDPRDRRRHRGRALERTAGPAALQPARSGPREPAAQARRPAPGRRHRHPVGNRLG